MKFIILYIKPLNPIPRIVVVVVAFPIMPFHVITGLSPLTVHFIDPVGYFSLLHILVLLEVPSTL